MKARLSHRLFSHTLCALFCLTLISGAQAAAEESRSKRVLMIATGSRLAPGFALVDQELLRELGKITSPPIETYAENLDLIRFSNKDYQRVFTEYLSAKYAGFSPDLIILSYVGNLAISTRLLSELFPRTPIVVAGFTEEALGSDALGPLITGVAQRTNPRAALELMLHVQPELRRIVLIAGTTEVDRELLKRLTDVAPQFSSRVAIEVWDKTMAQLGQEVATLPRDTAILFVRFFRDAAGQAFVSSEVAQRIAQIASVPMYVMTNGGFGSGAVGGSISMIEAFAQRAGEMARLLLTGTHIKSLLLEIRNDSVSMFDWRALQRWHINDASLPQHSVVKFRPESFWGEYRWYILAGAVIILLQGLTIIDLLMQRRRLHRMQEILRETQELTDLATSAGEVGLWSRDLTAGDIWANATTRSLFGFGPNEPLRFENMLSRVHPDDRARVLSESEHSSASALPFHGEFRTLLPDGTEHWVLAKGRTVADSSLDGSRRMGVMLDITERKRAEENLRESEDRFRAMANAAPVMIWMSGVDKLCTFFNKGWLDFTGRTLEQELGDGWAEGVHEEDLTRCLEIYGQAFDARQEFTIEYRLRRRDGEYRWVIDRGVPRAGSTGAFLGYIGTLLDITERKRAQEAVDKERRFLRQVIDTDPNFIFAKDRDGRFTLANRAVAEAYGTSVENLVGKTDEDFNRNREEVEFFRRIDRQVIDTMQERFIAEEHITDARGKIRWVQTVKRPIVESDGSAKQVLGASTDITRRKQAEAQLQEKRAELAHFGRVSVMGELAASLAHELNQPLTAIRSNAQAAIHFLNDSPPQMEDVRIILQDIIRDDARASDVIRRMRALVKKEEPDFAPLDVASLVRDVVVLMHSDAVIRNVRVSADIAENMPPILGDKVQLQQVMLNILLNAFDAMKDCKPHDREVKVRAYDQGARWAQFSFTDGGSGLSVDKLEKIFQPFYTTKGEGLGMGLSICRSILEAHGGRLWAENNPNRGATFYFTVPIVKPSEATGDGRSGPEAVTSNGEADQSYDASSDRLTLKRA